MLEKHSYSKITLSLKTSQKGSVTKVIGEGPEVRYE